MDWEEVIIPKLKLIEGLINNKPYLKEVINQILIQNKEWDTISDSLKCIFEDDIESFFKCLVAGSRERDFVEVTISEGFGEDFINWFYGLAVVHGIALFKLNEKNFKGYDWDSVKQTYISSRNGDSLLDVQFYRNDGEKFTIQGDRRSWLLLISTILPAIVQFFDESLSDLEESLIVKIEEQIEKVRQSETNSDESIS